jgi:hypothetical protein
VFRRARFAGKLTPDVPHPFSDRRSGAGEELADRLLHAREPVPFDDLADGRDVGEVAAWIGHGVSDGLVEEIPGGDGRRRFKLRDRGERIITRARRASDHS